MLVEGCWKDFILFEEFQRFHQPIIFSCTLYNPQLLWHEALYLTCEQENDHSNIQTVFTT